MKTTHHIKPGPQLRERLLPVFISLSLLSTGIQLSAQSLWPPPATFNHTVNWNGNSLVLNMSKQAIRGTNFEVLIQNSSGTYTAYSPGEERAYLGTVNGYPDATACGIIKEDGTFWGQISFDRGGMLGVLGNSVEFERSMRQPTTYKIPTTGTVGAGQIGATSMMAWDVATDVMSNEFVGNRGSNAAAMLEFVEYTTVSMRSIWMQDALLRPYLARTIFRGSTSTDPHITSPGLGTVRTEWNTNQTTADRDLVILYGRSVGAVAYSPGFYSGSNTWGYAVVPTNVNEGDWFAVQWHEVGHSWGCAHEEGDSPEGGTVLSATEFAERGSYSRFSGSEVKRILEVKSSALSNFGNQGTFTAVNIPPYASLDVASFKQFVQTQIQIPVLANDHDANAHTLSISSHDGSSARGGSVSQTGSGATAQLLYSAPTGYVGTDWFKYRVADSSGQTATGVVVINVVPDDALLGYWPLDDTTGTVAQDHSAYAKDGTLVNAPTPGAAGHFGNAVSFDGTEDRIQIPNLGLDSANATICGWIKRPSEDQASFAGILYNRSNGSTAALNFGSANELRYHWNGGKFSWNSGLVPPANQWVFVALVVEPTKATIYMHDGATLQSAINSGTHTAESFSAPSTLGSDGTGRYFTGQMDDFRVYRQPLTQQEILDLVTGGHAEAPHPVHKATEVKNGVLKWAGAASATTERVFVGTSEAAVAAATTSSLEYLGATTDATWTFAPQPATTYYWRIDSVASSTVINGPVWRFTTGGEVFDPRLAALWRFDDGSGSRAREELNRLDGTLWYGAGWTTGKAGGGVAFDGVNDHISIPVPMLNNMAKFTIAGWYRSPLTSGNRVGLWGQNDVFEFGINGSSISLWTAGGSISTPLPATNQWHHVACVGDGSAVKIYVDGVLAKTGGNAIANYGSSGTPFRIGGGGIWDTNGNFFTGDIDDVRVYRAPLSAGDVTNLYLGGATRPSYSVALATNDPSAAEAGLDPGGFTVTRTGGENADELIVYFSVGGTATNGTDYSNIGSSVVIPAGQTSAPIHINVIQDSLDETDETVVLTLLAHTTYVPGGTVSGTVTILDDDTAPIVTIISPATGITSIPADVGLILEANATDDGHPQALVTTWSKVSGPGTVIFGDAGSQDTTATFSTTGAYVLRISAFDGGITSTDDVAVTVGGSNGESFTNVDIAAPRSGSGSLSGDTFTGSGAGADIYGRSDQFNFHYVPVTGDFDIRARLVSKTVSSIGAHTAIMARETTAANSTHVSMTQEGASGSTYLMRRASTEANTTINIGGSVNNSPPTWMRLQRIGDTFNGYVSEDGITWTARSTGAMTLPSTMLVGFSVSNASASASAALNTVVFDNVSGFPSTNNGPLVNAGIDQSTNMQVALIGSASDDNLPNPPAVLTTTWQKVSGPGAVNFTDANVLATTASFSQGDNYVLRLVADDGEVKTFDDVAITASSVTVTLAASDPVATEHGQAIGIFTLTRSGSTSAALTVRYTIAGTATNGADYADIPTSTTILPGENSATITVDPLPDNLSEGNETVQLMLVADPLYTIGAPGGGIVTIADKPMDSWRLIHFGDDANDSGISGDLCDPDADGLSNLLEYAIGTNPAVADTGAIIHDMVEVAGMKYLRLNVTKNPAAIDVQLAVQVTGDLANPAGWNTTETTIEQDTSTSLIVRDTVTASRRFMRLQVTRP